MEPRLMASINRCLKEGMNAHCSAPGSVGKKGGDADERAPRCSERERGEKSANRRALPRSERGKGEGAWAVLAERAAPLGRVCIAGGGGELGRQRLKARGERGV